MAVELADHIIRKESRHDTRSNNLNLLGKSFSDKRKEQLYHELEALISSGVDLKGAIDMLVEEQQSSKANQVLDNVRKQVERGSTFAHALENSGQFSPYEYHSIRIGEETGRLSDVLKELTLYYERKIKTRRQIIGIFTYPVFVLIITIGVVWFMLSNVVPMFANVFERFGEELPAVTKIVVSSADWIQAHGSTVLLAILSTVLITYSQRRKRWYRSLSARVMLRIPVFGKMVKLSFLTRFTQSMALLSGASTPLVQSIELTRKMIRFLPMEESLAIIQKDVTQGSALHVAMAKHALYPSKMVSLVKVAEEVNQLEKMFHRLNKNYTAELEQRSKVVGSIMEPLMIMVIGGLVGFILIAMYLPMFQLSSAI